MKNRKMCRIVSFILFICAFGSFKTQGTKTFPIEDINPELNNSNQMKIIVFMPSISEDTEYASMIVQAFKNYFVEKLAFDPQDRNKAAIDIILVSHKDKIGDEIRTDKISEDSFFLDDEVIKKQINDSLFNTKGMQVFYGINETLKSKLHLSPLEDIQASSVLFLLDKSNKIIWRDDQYRGQGEHLKPLEYKIKNLLGFHYPQITPIDNHLKEGDKAPDVIINKEQKISDYKGDIMVLTFYPAAYSGTFDTRSKVRRLSMNRLAVMSCAVHITTFDEMSLLQNNKVKYFAISESTPEILKNWKQALDTYHIEYVNDSDYIISQAFGSYNPEGYNNRMTVIIDAEGNIAYIDNDYKLNKEIEIQKIIQKLQIQK